jgi:hypothetical protein
LLEVLSRVFLSFGFPLENFFGFPLENSFGLSFGKPFVFPLENSFDYPSDFPLENPLDFPLETILEKAPCSLFSLFLCPYVPMSLFPFFCFLFLERSVEGFVKSLKYKHKLKAEQLQRELTSADLVLVFQSSHWTMQDSLRLEKESDRVFVGGEKVSYRYFRGRNSIYRRLVLGIYRDFLNLLSGPSFLLSVKWPVNSLLSAHTGVACLRTLFSDQSEANGKSLPFYKVVGCFFEGRVLSGPETEALLGVNGASGEKESKMLRFEEATSESEAFRPFLNALGGSYMVSGGQFLNCLEQIENKE